MKNKLVVIIFLIAALTAIILTSAVFADKPVKQTFETIEKLNGLKNPLPERINKSEGAVVKKWNDGNDKVITLNQYYSMQDVSQEFSREVLGSSVDNYEIISLKNGSTAIFYSRTLESQGKKESIYTIAWSKQQDTRYNTFSLSFTEKFTRQEMLDIIQSANYADEEYSDEQLEHVKKIKAD